MSASHWEEWLPVRIYGQGLQPHTGKHWNCVPAWDVTAVYPEPDGVLPHPDFFRAQRGDDGDLPNRDEKRCVFWDRHIDRRFHLEYPLASKDRPRVQGRTIGDPAREWDILIEHRDRCLSEAGLTLDSPAEEIVRALAEVFGFAQFSRKPHTTTFAENNRQLNHPIEGLLFQSHCVGQAVAFAALADACALPARDIGCGGHWIAEVHVGEGWRCADSIGRHEKSRDVPRFFYADYLDITLDPMGDHAGDVAMPESLRDGLWGRPKPQFHFPNGTWGSPLTLRYGAGCAHACYPGKEKVGIRSVDGRSCAIIARARGFYWPTVHSSDNALLREIRRASFPSPASPEGFTSDHLYHAFRPGEKLRQSVYLDALDDMDAMELVIPFGWSLLSDFSDAVGRQIVLRIGDCEKSLADLGAWPPVKTEVKTEDGAVCEANVACTIRLEPDVFRPHGVNWIELHQNSNTLFYMPMTPAVLDPYLPPLWSETADAFNPPRA